MKRSIFPRFLGIGAFAVLAVASGCKAPTIQYSVLQTASLRIMNFAPNCTSPMDVYWAPFPPGPATNAAANIHVLPYGAASVYTTSIPANANGTQYQVVVRPAHDTVSSDIKVPITLIPQGKYTIVVTHDPNNPAAFLSTTLTDAVQPAGADPTKQTFIRFMNLQPNVGSLQVRVNDPVTGDPIGAAQDFNQYTSYVALNTALDTSFAFYVTNTSGQIISKLTYQTFVAGNYYTLVYAGDLCNTPLITPGDTVNDADDTLRLRAFDDNGSGADQTNPPPLTYRFNIINGLTSGSGVDVTQIGYIVNGADFPEYGNFSIPPIGMDSAGGTGRSFSSSDNVINVNYQSGAIPPAPATGVSVAATALLNDTVNLGQLFSQVMTFGTAIVPNHSVSFLFYDTITSKITASGTKSLVFPMPDTSNDGAALLVFVPAVYGASSKPISATAQESVVFDYWVNGTEYPFKWYSSKGAYAGLVAHTATPAYEVPITQGTPITITDSIWGTVASGTAKIPLPSQTFTAQPGGIYEIVAVGNYNDPSTYKTLIIRVNGQ